MSCPTSMRSPNAGRSTHRARRSADAAGPGGPTAQKGSELAEQIIGRADLELARRLDVELLHNAILDQHRVTLAALAHAELRAVHGEAHRVGKGAVAVGEHGDVRGVIGLRP